MKWVKPLVLQGVTDDTEIEAMYADSNGLYSTDYGLNGKNQIIGIVDGGIDPDHCFFYDSTPTISTADSLLSDPTIDDITVYSDHSKINSIISVRSDHAVEDSSHHGTFCAGIIAGKAPATFDFGSRFNGVAERATLSVIDIRSGTNDFQIPNNNLTSVFQYTYLVGGRIQAHSWAGTAPNSFDSTIATALTYNTVSAQFDKYAYEHQDFLPVVAAGFQYCPSDYGSSQIGAAGRSRNALVVGAHMSNFAATDFLVGKGEDLPYNYLNSTQQSLVNSSDGIYVLTTRHVMGNSSLMKPDVVAPAMMVISANGGTVNSGSCGTTGFGEDEDLWYFDQYYGASLSASVVAGMAAVVRQYFMEGWYPTGLKSSSDEFANPSAALVKAMVIHGAVSVPEDLTAYRLHYSNFLSYDCGPYMEDVSSYPSASGFGFVQNYNSMYLKQVSTHYLYLPGHDETSNTTLGDPYLVWSTDAPESATVSYSYCVFQESSNMPVKITLVWTDYSSGATSASLVNDLDLTVDYEGDAHYGNEKYSDSTDTVNNVEVITLDAPTTSGSKKDITITVTASSIWQDGEVQAFALILSGYVAEGDCASAVDPAGDGSDFTTSDGSTWEFWGLTAIYWYIIAVGAGIFICCCGGCLCVYRFIKWRVTKTLSSNADYREGGEMSHRTQI